MIGLTPRQAECLNAIRRLTVKGVPPSYECLRSELGLSGAGGVHRLLHALRDRGAITFEPFKARSIRVLDDVEGLESRTSDHLRAVRDRIDQILRSRAS